MMPVGQWRQDESDTQGSIDQEGVLALLAQNGRGRGVSMWSLDPTIRTGTKVKRTGGGGRRDPGSGMRLPLLDMCPSYLQHAACRLHVQDWQCWCSRHLAVYLNAIAVVVHKRLDVKSGPGAVGMQL